MPKVPVNECPAGTAMDASIAEALGWVKVECDGIYYWSDPTIDEWHNDRVASGCSAVGHELEDVTVWSPSTDIAAAWELVDAMPYFKIMRLSETYWQCQGVRCGDWGDHLLERKGNPVCDCRFGDASTAPLAICRAFLKAKGVEFIEMPEGNNAKGTS